MFDEREQVGIECSYRVVRLLSCYFFLKLLKADISGNLKFLLLDAWITRIIW
jgi:hypothetical protein